MISKSQHWAPHMNKVAFPRLSTQLFDWMRALTFLFIFILPIWPVYAELRLFGLPNVAPTRILGLLLFALFCACFFLSPERQSLFLRRFVRNWGFFLMLAAFYVFKAVSAARATSPVVGVYEFIKLDLLAVLPVFFYSLFVLQGGKDIRRVMMLLSCSAFVIALITIVEVVLKKNVFTMVLPIASAAMQLASVGGFRDSVYRAQGSFEHPLALAEFMSAVLPFCVFLLLKSQRSFSRFFYLLTVLLIFVAIYLSRTRAGMGAMAVAFVLLLMVLGYGWLRSSKNYVAQYLVLLQIPALLCVLVVAGLGYRDYFVGKSVEERRSTFLRVEMLDKGLPLILRNPVVGLGQGRGADAIGIKAAKGFSTVDNYYLLLALNSGLPSVALFSAIFIALAASLWRVSRRLGEELSLVAPVLAISLLVFALHATIQSLTTVFPLLFLIFAMILVLREEVDTAPFKQ